MIYRVIAACPGLSIRDADNNEILAIDVRLRGAGACLGWVMWQRGLLAPLVTNRRARFYFTERGWDQVGREVVRAARREGRPVRVVRRKNPDHSQIVYRDHLQVAILPHKGRTA